MKTNLLRACGQPRYQSSTSLPSDLQRQNNSHSFPFCLFRRTIPMQKTSTRSPSLLNAQRLTALASRIRIDPRFREIDDKPLSVLGAFESIGQPADAVRMPLPVSLPGNLRARAPLLVALIQGSKSNDQTIVVIEVSHAGRNYRHVASLMPIIPSSQSAASNCLISEPKTIGLVRSDPCVCCNALSRAPHRSGPVR